MVVSSCAERSLLAGMFISCWQNTSLGFSYCRAQACNQWALQLPQVWQPLVGVAIALLVALLAVRALGETDLNPVSGVGKLSQVHCTALAKL